MTVAGVLTEDGHRLWTAATGTGPPLVLCHGGPGLWDMLGGLAAALADRHTVHRWDQMATPWFPVDLAATGHCGRS